VLFDDLAEASDRHRLREVGRRLGALAERIVAEAVLVELEPQVAQFVRRVVVVGDAGRADEFGRRGVERHRDVVVDLLLPVGGAGRARRRALVVRRRQHFVELPERVALAQDRRRHDERAARVERGVRRTGEDRCGGECEWRKRRSEKAQHPRTVRETPRHLGRQENSAARSPRSIRRLPRTPRPPTAR